MRLKNLDLIIAVIIALTNILWTLLHSDVPVIAVILAVPLVFILPGYTLSEAVFYTRVLDFSHRFVLSLGLSLAIDILGGLLLSILPIGLRAASWAVLLGLVTVIFSALVVYRRWGSPVNRVVHPRSPLTIYAGVMLGLAIAVVVLSMLYDIRGAVQQPHSGFTQLWMLPDVQTGKSCAFHLGVRSFETTSVQYHVIMSIEGMQTSSWPSITLSPQQEWNKQVPIAPRTSDHVQARAELYRLDKPQAPYRTVDVTLQGCAITPTSFSGLASTYKGTTHAVGAKSTTEMSLIGIQESKGNVHGYLLTATTRRNPFEGVISATKDIQFTVTNERGVATSFFNGTIQSDGDLVGNYCSLSLERQCISEYGYGAWSAAPAS